VLGDGTRIVVAPGSRISIDSGFNETHRTVQLEGVAYFTVSHEGSHPFIVRTNRAEVRDIGTAFVVKASGERVVVSVTDGQVRVTRTGQKQSVDLFAGDRVTIPASDSQATVARKSSTEDDKAWTTGRLVYRDAVLSDVIDDLERWYGVRVQADRSLLNRTLHAELDTDSLPQALRIVSLALGADVVTRGNQLFLEQHDSRRSR
jgi:transmembrane sensor